MPSVLQQELLPTWRKTASTVARSYHADRAFVEPVQHLPSAAGGLPGRRCPGGKGNPRCLRNLYKATQQLVEDRLAALREQMYDQILELEQEAIGWPVAESPGGDRTA